MAETKQGTDNVIPAEVTQLIGESHKIQGWIEKLAELRDETTPAVYEKVHTDYRARLAEMTARLAEHRSDLSKSLEKRRTGVERLRSERDEQAAELEEAKLRFAVGEYGSDEWDERRERIERGLQSIQDRLSSEDASLEELEAILTSIPPEGGAAAPPKEKPAAEPIAKPAWMESVEASTLAPTEQPAEPKADAVKEKAPRGEPAQPAADASTKKAEKTPTGAATPAGPQRKAGEGRAREGEGGEYLDELEFLESLSLEESDRFDAVSAMLDDEEAGKGGSE